MCCCAWSPRSDPATPNPELTLCTWEHLLHHPMPPPGARAMGRDGADRAASRACVCPQPMWACAAPRRPHPRDPAARHQVRTLVGAPTTVGGWVVGQPSAPCRARGRPTAYSSVPSSTCSSWLLFADAAGHGADQRKEVERTRPAPSGVQVPEAKAGIKGSPFSVRTGAWEGVGVLSAEM